MSQSAKKDTKKDKGFTEAERAAMKERARELKANANKAEAESAVLAKIAEMPESERLMAQRIHEIVKADAPSLSPKLWYGMPAYANDAGKIICFFQSATKFDARYATFGFNDMAMLDDGVFWPVAFAITAMNPAVETKISELVKKATS